MLILDMIWSSGKGFFIFHNMVYIYIYKMLAFSFVHRRKFVSGDNEDSKQTNEEMGNNGIEN